MTRDFYTRLMDGAFAKPAPTPQHAVTALKGIGGAIRGKREGTP